VAARGIHHVDLAVADVDASLAFYLDLLRPLGLAEEIRYPTYRGTEEVVYLVDAHDRRGIGLRPADGSAHSYYDVGIEHIAFEVESRDDVDAAHERCPARGARIHFPPEEDRDEEGYYAFFVFDPNRVTRTSPDSAKLATRAPTTTLMPPIDEVLALIRSGLVEDPYAAAYRN
jgi:catechol 2,3-dioxygenase-like lactoylglutathione lyase family enzyme